jgi:DNA repair protein RecO (recombination protein O)
VLGHLEDRIGAGMLMVRFELQILAELGFGLDLSSCAATGTLEDLGYVSPKSGRAVSRAAAAPWQDRLLRLPAFVSEARAPSPEELADGFALTAFFLTRHVLEPRGIVFADARDGFVSAVLGRRGMPPAA